MLGWWLKVEKKLRMPSLKITSRYLSIVKWSQSRLGRIVALTCRRGQRLVWISFMPDSEARVWDAELTSTTVEQSNSVISLQYYLKKVHLLFNKLQKSKPYILVRYKNYLGNDP